MRTYLQDYQVVSCKTVGDVLAAINENPAPVPLAGGTDLLVQLNYGRLPSGKYINLSAVEDFALPIEIDEHHLYLSPLATYMDVRMHPFFKKNLPMLANAASVVGAPGIQTRGTWAGNIVNASPAADGVPALMVYGAKLELSSLNEKRVVELADFYNDYKSMDRKQNEIITRIIVPIPKVSAYEYYRKVGERKAQAISKVLLAARLQVIEQRINEAYIVFGSVMPYTYRARNLEKLLVGQKLEQNLIAQAIKSIGEELKPIDDIRSTARYRRKVAQNLLRECLQGAIV